MKLELPKMRLEHSFKFFAFLHAYLVKPCLEIQACEIGCSSQLVEQFFDNGNRVLALLSDGIQLAIINTKTPSLVLFHQ